MLSGSLVTAAAIAGRVPVSKEAVSRVIQQYPMRINPYALGLISHPGDPLWRQIIPDENELANAGLPDADPLCESAQSPVSTIVHRYPDRVLLLVSNHCAVYCRHCMRKRVVGETTPVTPASIEAGIDYIAGKPGIKEVILSGGDPLMLGDQPLSVVLKLLREINHVELIRVHTRAPGMLPQRITTHLAQMLARFHPLYVNIQFNHPEELTPEAVGACTRLADAGIPLGAQTVLLAGVNDSPDVMIQLMRKLLAARVKPYYLHHPDPVKGTAHFRVPLERGLAILESLRGHVSGIGVPQYMIDLPGGGGKVPLLPEYVVDRTGNRLVVYNFEKKRYIYPL